MFAASAADEAYDFFSYSFSAAAFDDVVLIGLVAKWSVSVYLLLN